MDAREKQQRHRYLRDQEGGTHPPASGTAFERFTEEALDNARSRATPEAAPHLERLSLGFYERNRAGARVWAMGPMTKGKYWEIIAVPDIRDQAAQVAADIERELGA